ncbi:membrane protein [Streptomyces sp. SBT349]|uniref:membrane protein n=1 Tax=Streptomyces sp. SBT349 TaxID=1580539 RepID=UPI00066CB56E|nr:membrane protein [Streptomyces sp. SBT349]
MSDLVRAFRHSPYAPAVVVGLLVAGSAGLFAGSYIYAMANPTPHDVPVAVVGEPDPAFLRALEHGLDASLDRRRYGSRPQAVDAVEDQKVFAIVAERRGVMEVDTVSAAGSEVAMVLAKGARAAAKRAGTEVRVRDLKPLNRGDPRGLALFYVTIAAVIVGFLGAVQLGFNASALTPRERVLFIAGYAVLGGFSIVGVVGWVTDAVGLPFLTSWGILSLTMFTSGMIFTMFNTLVRRWAILPTWVLMVMLGNPSSGGAVSWPLLPSLLGTIGRWLPPGAAVNALHNAVYFPGHQHAQPYVVLAAWAALSLTVFAIWRRRHPGGRG